jgi:LEA14-like dessication related protein
MNARRAPVLLLALALAACATTARPQAPRVSVETVVIDRMTPADAQFSVTLKLDNPNDQVLAVDEISSFLRLEDIVVGTARLAAPVRLPPHAVGTATLITHADWPATMRAVIAAAKRAEAQPQADPKVRYAVTGLATLDGGLTLPFARNGELAWPRNGGAAR